MKKQEKKLILKKLIISKLNNIKIISGGNMDTLAGPTYSNCVTKKTYTKDSFFDCPTIICPSNQANC